MKYPLAPEHEGQWSIIHRKLLRELIPTIGTQAMGVYALLATLAGARFACSIDKGMLALESDLPPKSLHKTLQSLVHHRVIAVTETTATYNIVLNWKPLSVRKEQEFCPPTDYTNDTNTRIYKKSNESNRFNYELTKHIKHLKKNMYTPEQKQKQQI